MFSDRDHLIDARLLRGMGEAISHRGPDAEGIWCTRGLGLVHRRLSIIDLAGGDQPQSNEDGSVQVVFNGEIYNYRELRTELLAHGHCLRTKSDTEVLVHLYEELGSELVKRLRGQFAFALWDVKRKQLLLARDRVGQKPLYFYRDSEKLVFASELKAILAYPNIDRAVDIAAVEDYLAFGFIPGSRSIFRFVEKLPPAHVLTIATDRWSDSPKRYWCYPSPKLVSRSVDDWKEAVQAKVAETVRSHMVADVPVGAFLSGGMDSSVVVAEAAAVSNEPLRTFSIGFGDDAISELPYAREVANQYGCTHTEEVVTADAAADLDDLVHYFDEPFADTSAIPTLKVSRLARQSVKVVLSGDGGDEAFGGYRRYVHDLREYRLRRWVPGWARRTIAAPLAQAWPKSDWLPKLLRAKTLLTNLSLAPAEAYANTVATCRAQWRRRLLAEDLRAELNGHRPEAAIVDRFGDWGTTHDVSSDPLARMIATDINVLLPDDFLTKVDRASMAFGLEVRPPLVDHELLELTSQIPSDLKVRRGEGKWIFKQAFRHRIPASICDRPKQGFEIPIDRWLRGPLRQMFEDTALQPRASVAVLLNQRTVGEMYRSHLRGVGHHGQVLWSVLVLARWCERYLTATSPQTTDLSTGSLHNGMVVQES